MQAEYTRRAMRLPGQRQSTAAAALLTVLLTGGANAGQETVYFASVDSVLAREPLAPGDTLRVTTLARGPHSTAVLIQLAPGARVPGHVHREHDETAQLVRGSARVRVGAGVRELRPGDVAVMPQGTPHGAVAGPAGAVFVSVYAPSWDPADRHRDPRGDP